MRFIFRNFIFIILFTVFSAGYFILCTDRGLHTSIQIISHFLPGKLTIETSEGKLSSKFTLHNISYQDSQQKMTVGSIEFSWLPVGLLRDTLIIKKIVLNNADIEILNTSTSSSELDLSWLQSLILKQFEVHNLKIHNANTLIEFDGILSDQWNIAWHSDIQKLNQLITNSTGSFTSSGTISGPKLTPTIKANFKGSNLMIADQKIQKLDGVININLQPKTDSSLSVTAQGIKINNYPLRKLELTSTGSIAHLHQALIGRLNLTLAKQHTFSAEFSLPKFTRISDLGQPLAGKINFNTSHLELLNDLIPVIRNARGIAKADIALNGTLGSPTVSGNFELREGHAYVPQLGVHLDKIILQASSNQAKKILYKGTFQAGNGKANFQGDIDFSQTDIPITLLLKGENLQIFNLSEYKISATPNLKLRFVKQTLDIQGNVLIPQADILPKNFENTVTLPNEVVFVDEPEVQAELPFDITMLVNLHLGDKIHVAYKDLKADLSGDLHIKQNPEGFTTATGELYTTKGTYKAYGQVFKIQEGRLIFKGGPLINPGVNIRTTKQIKTVATGGGTSSFTNQQSTLTPIYTGTDLLTVGVQIEGTSEQPLFSLFSIPAGLKQNDILSYLLFGYPQAQVSEHQNRMLLSAASSLNFSGKTKFNNLTDELQSTLGLNELSIESMEIFNPTLGKSSSTTSFVIGKQIGPRLYAHYSIGLFDPVSILNLRYQISKRFAIQSETSTIDNGADLLYSIERD